MDEKANGRTHHGRINHIRSIGRPNDEHRLSGVEAIELSEEGVDDAGGGFRLSVPACQYKRLQNWITTALTRLSSRLGTSASSSSKNITQGAEARAREKTWRTARSLSPTYYEKKRRDQ